MISLPNPKTTMIDSVELHSTLVELCKENDDLLEQILDEYVSSLNIDELKHLEDFIVNNFGDD
jgi:hypothetical protein